MSELCILAGDIGGTNTRLALYAVEGSTLRPLRATTYPSREAAGLEALVRRFVSEGETPRLGAAALAVAGPVIDGRCVATNLPWVLEEAALAEAAKVAHLRLLNDLQAMAFGVLFVPANQLISLNGLAPRARGHAAVIAAGTGLGQAYLHWDGFRHLPAPSEGSHGEFGPRNEVQVELARFLIARHGHPSTERVVSGPGFSRMPLGTLTRPRSWSHAACRRSTTRAGSRPSSSAAATTRVATAGECPRRAGDLRSA